MIVGVPQIADGTRVGAAIAGGRACRSPSCSVRCLRRQGTEEDAAAGPPASIDLCVSHGLYDCGGGDRSARVYVLRGAPPELRWSRSHPAWLGTLRLFAALSRCLASFPAARCVFSSALFLRGPLYTSPRGPHTPPPRARGRRQACGPGASAQLVPPLARGALRETDRRAGISYERPITQRAAQPGR